MQEKAAEFLKLMKGKYASEGAEGLKELVRTQVGHSMRTATTVRFALMSLGVDNKEVVRWGGTDTECQNALAEIAVQKIRSGSPAKVIEITPPQGETEHQERVALIQDCKRLEDQFPSKTTYPDSWWNSATLDEIRAYRELLKEHSENTSEQEEAPTPTVSYTEGNVLSTGFVIPEEISGDAALLAAFKVYSTMEVPELCQSADKATMSKIRRILGLKNPDGTPLGRGFNMEDTARAFVWRVCNPEIPYPEVEEKKPVKREKKVVERDDLLPVDEQEFLDRLQTIMDDSINALDSIVKRTHREIEELIDARKKHYRLQKSSQGRQD